MKYDYPPSPLPPPFLPSLPPLRTAVSVLSLPRLASPPLFPSLPLPLPPTLLVSSATIKLSYLLLRHSDSSL
eukprot:749818-Hanusia_phi.AAC.7